VNDLNEPDFPKKIDHALIDHLSFLTKQLLESYKEILFKCTEEELLTTADLLTEHARRLEKISWFYDATHTCTESICSH
jgi:DNA-binding ferritin-like protein